jgi:hypothetical protein
MPGKPPEGTKGIGGSSNKPGQSFCIGGSRPTGRIRIRQGLFRCYIEELWENRDGSAEWKACVGPVILKAGNPC